MTAERARAPVAHAFTIRPLITAAELHQCVQLQRDVWGPDFSAVVPPPILTLATRLGGILAGAFDDGGGLLGFVFGLTGVVDGRVVHWSDMLAVRADARDRGIGDALKRHQRDTLLARGVALVQWTFEPLESRNAHVNFARLGVTAREYARDFYAGSDSPLHGDIGTDRLVVDWAIATERVARRLAGEASPPRLDDVVSLPRINAHDLVAGQPRSAEPDLALDAPRLLLAIPAAIQALKRADAARARDWRAVTRAAFEAYFGRGYEAVDYVRGGDVGFYLLERATA